MVAQATQAAGFFGIAVLAPSLQNQYDLSLREVGILLAAPSAGLIPTLLLWGVAADRFGERAATVAGLGAGAAAYAGAAYAPSPLVLGLLIALGNAASGSTSAATGRVVAGWFPPAERGMALGLRQTAVPLGGVLAAIVLPQLVEPDSARVALLALAAAYAVGAFLSFCLLREGWVDIEVDPDSAFRHPIRDPRLRRLILGCAALMSTQVTVLSFVVLFLEDQRDFSTAVAGATLAAINIAGMLGRLAAGAVSDRMGARASLIRATAAGTSATMFATVAVLEAPAWLLIPLLVISGGLAMSWNGVAFVAAIEVAGRGRAGVALGLLQTPLALVGVVVPLAMAAVIHVASWHAAFALAGAFPLLALVAFRPRDEARRLTRLEWDGSPSHTKQ
jgi:sugar phosphate permease